MLVNLIVFVVLLALVGLFGWLTYRAIRARKLWVKIAGGILGGLATFVFLAVTLALGKGMLDLYRPYPVAAANVTIAGTPEQIARGQHLAEFLCASCHSPNSELPLNGGNNLSNDTGLPLGDVYPPNITPAGKIQDLSDADIFRILRTGVDPHGRLTAMAFFPVRYLSDEDAQAIIAYLRESQPVASSRPALNPSPLFVTLLGLGMMKAEAADAPIAPVTAPPKAATQAYGEYIANYGACQDCHGPNLTGNAPPPAPPGAPNLTVIMPQWSKEDFFQAMRTGVDPTGRQIDPLMPWKTIGKLDDVELAALYEYLHALTPITAGK